MKITLAIMLSTCKSGAYHCMMVIFSNFLEQLVKVFMDDFLVFGDFYNLCLENFEVMLRWCEETNLGLS